MPGPYDHSEKRSMISDMDIGISLENQTRFVRPRFRFFCC